jgi:hypothetical protein
MSGRFEKHGRANHQRGSVVERNLYAEVSVRIVVELVRRDQTLARDRWLNTPCSSAHHI